MLSILQAKYQVAGATMAGTSINNLSLFFFKAMGCLSQIYNNVIK